VERLARLWRTHCKLENVQAAWKEMTVAEVQDMCERQDLASQGRALRNELKQACRRLDIEFKQQVRRGRKQKALQDRLYAYHWERLILQQVAVQAQRERSMETAPASPAT
jgi:hypothetical protein